MEKNIVGEDVSAKDNIAEGKEGFLYLPILIFVLAQIGTSADNNVLNIAINPVRIGLEATLNQVQVATMVYAMWAGSFMIVSGMVGLIIGWKNNFRIGAFMCMVGEIVLATSSNISTFTWIGRSLVGLGGSFLIPSVLALVVVIYKKQQRAKAFGFIAAASGISYTIPLIAGLAIDKLGWRIAFWILAVYFAIVLVGSFAIPTPAKREGKSEITMDFIGSALGATGLFLLLIGISKISVWGVITPINAPFTIFGISPNLPMIVLGSVIIGILIYIEPRIEKKNGSALIPESFLKTKQTRSGLAILAVTFLALGGFGMVLIPFLQVVAGYSSLQTGIVMLTMGLSVFTVSLTLPKFVEKLSIKYLMVIGILGICLASIGMASSFSLESVNPIFYAFVVLFGASVGILSSNGSNITTANINPRDAQQSGGIQATFRNIGGSLAIATLGMVLLVSLPLSFNSNIQKSDAISESAKQTLTQENISFISNTEFKDAYGELISADELEVASEINKTARLSSTRNALYGMAVMCLIFLPVVKNVPHTLFKD